MSALYWLAWALPWLSGTALYLALVPQRANGWWASALGYGFFVGLLLAAALLALAERLGVAQPALWAACLLVAVVVAASVLALRRARTGAVPVRDDPLPISLPLRATLALLLASLLLRAGVAAREVWLRPLYPWDAWSAWAVKAKTWFLLGHFVPFVPMAQWLRAAVDAHTGVAWFYPTGLAWIELWFADAAGGWIEPLINLPWIGAWAALLLAHYGQWRALGMPRAAAVLCVYLLGSLPLLIVHAALAGYADLWLALAFGLGVLAWMRWLQHGARAQLVLSILCALSLPWLKMEGWVWAGCLLGAIGYAQLPRRWRRWTAIATALAFVVLVPCGGLRWLCLQAGVIGADGSVAAPGIGPLALVFDLRWRPGALTSAAQTLLAQPNWHLLWWVTPALVVLRWRALLTREWLRQPAKLLGLCALLLLILFAFTGASVWAQSFTAINRLVLQLTPAWVSVMALLLSDPMWPAAASDTSPQSAARSAAG